MKQWISILIIAFWPCAAAAQHADTLTTADTTSWHKDGDFSYMATLDSLLRVANQRADSATVQKIGTGKTAAASNGFATFFQSTVVQVLFWSGLAVFVIYIIYALFFRYPAGKKMKEQSEAEILEEGKLLEQDIYKQKITAAEAQAQYRWAVRFHFLRILAQLDALGKIHFAPEKTNADYISELKDDYRLDGFRKLSEIFMYVWYGKREINAEAYEEIKQLFIENYQLG